MPLHKVDEPSSSKVLTTEVMDLAFPNLEVALGRILEMGIEEAPHEACGILVNETQGVRVVKLVNRAEDPTSSYRIDNTTLRQIALKPEMWAHVAVWHTHPGGHVGPSPGDLAVKVQGVKYVVVTIPTGEVRWF